MSVSAPSSSTMVAVSGESLSNTYKTRLTPVRTTMEKTVPYHSPGHLEQVTLHKHFGGGRDEMVSLALKQ